jgi:hypothetical protein
MNRQRDVDEWMLLIWRQIAHQRESPMLSAIVENVEQFEKFVAYCWLPPYSAHTSVKIPLTVWQDREQETFERSPFCRR